MQQKEFIHTFLPLAQKAGEAYRINPVVILAQAVIESGWGQSVLSTRHHNYFGITAYGKKNVWWTGTSVCLSEKSLRFRSYPDPSQSFMDYTRLIRQAYSRAADMSSQPRAFALEISYSKYISEVNGDNREAYRKLLVRICRQIQKTIDSSTHLSLNHPNHEVS